jgi:1,4-dihydroxy-6-naphthoate synthase
MAIEKKLDTTAVSAHAYLTIQDDYRIMDCGASMGDGYGPIVVSKKKLLSTKDIKIGIPGKLTSAFLLLQLYCDDAEFVEYDFDSLFAALDNDEIDAALIIHEGQITYEELGYNVLVDIPKLWASECEYPIPLGLNVIRRSFSIEHQEEISQLIKSSINYALSNIDIALDYAMKFGRGVSRDIAKEFVLMYVNSDTVDINFRGIYGLEFFYTKALQKKIITKMPKLDIIKTK